MPLLQLRPKRQLTLPREVTEPLNLRTGDYLEAETKGDKIVLSVKEVRDRPPKRSLLNLVGSAQGVYGSREEIDQMVADSRTDR